MKAEDEQRCHELAQEVLLERGTSNRHVAGNRRGSGETDRTVASRVGGRQSDGKRGSRGRKPSRRAASPLCEVWRSAASAREAHPQADHNGGANGAALAQVRLLSHLSGGLFSLYWLLGISVRKESVTGYALRSCSLRSTHHVGGEKVSSMTVWSEPLTTGSCTLSMIHL